MKVLRSVPRTNDIKDLKTWMLEVRDMFNKTGRISWLALDTEDPSYTSNSLANGWEDHKNSTGNPHNAVTDNVPEGSSNLYFTDERVDDRVFNLIVIPVSNALTRNYDDAANTLTLQVTKAPALADVSTTVSGAADIVYSATEMDMINALKNDVETLRNVINTLLSNLRSANLQST